MYRQFDSAPGQQAFSITAKRHLRVALLFLLQVVQESVNSKDASDTRSIFPLPELAIDHHIIARLVSLLASAFEDRRHAID